MLGSSVRRQIVRSQIVESDRSDGGTRAAVIRLLVERPAAAVEIAERLGISPAGVRRHLDALSDEGAVTSRECRSRGPRGRGRPAREYLLTDAGRSKLPHAYDELAVEALEFLQRFGGEDAVMAFARDRAEALIDKHRGELAAANDGSARIDVLASALSEAGYAATVAEVGIGEQLCQHHCPVAHVAAKFPQLCQAELDVFGEAIGSYAQRLATIARGDSFCTTFVPTPTDLPMPAAVASHGAATSDTHQISAVPQNVVAVPTRPTSAASSLGRNPQ